MKIDPSVQDHIKKEIAQKALEWIEPGMLLGLGTGSTATLFIHALAQKCREGLEIQAVCSSKFSEKLARELAIPLLASQDFSFIDLTIDGADEVDPKNQLIKGGGGALTREKIVARASKELLILVDESKLVEKLGAFGLPVEILPFGAQATLKHLNTLGYEGKIRTKSSGEIYVTDNGNWIVDLRSPKEFVDPSTHHERISCTPGVVETGLFFDQKLNLLIGYKDGTLKTRI